MIDICQPFFFLKIQWGLQKKENLHKKGTEVESKRPEFLESESLKWIQGKSLRSTIGGAFLYKVASLLIFVIIVNVYIGKATILLPFFLFLFHYCFFIFRLTFQITLLYFISMIFLGISENAESEFCEISGL